MGADDRRPEGMPRRAGTAGAPWLRAIGRRRVLWNALAVVILSMVVLLSLQYRALVDLQRSTAVAHAVALEDRLAGIAHQVSDHVTAVGEGTLRVPARLFTAPVDEVDRYVFDRSPQSASTDNARGPAVDSQAPGREVSHLFLVPLRGEFEGRVLAYDLGRHARLDQGEIAPSTQLALSYWQTRAVRMPASLNPKELMSDDRDPGRPMLLSVVADEQGALVGLTALVIDVDVFARHTLPALLRRALPVEGSTPQFAVSVWDAFDKEVIVARWASTPHFEVKRSLGSVFSGWTIALGGRDSTGAESARASFIGNVVFSTILAGVVLAGIVLAMRTAAREMKLSEIKSDFVSNVSHELRTPLSSIRVFGELLRLGRVSDPEKVREYGGHIESEGRRLTQLIDNILDFSRIESGARVYHLEEHDPADFVREVLQAFGPRLERDGFQVEFVVPATPPPMVRIDEAAISRALGNLIDNAIKYSGDSRRLCVTLAVDGRELSVAVRDFGIGIPREEHERIFDRFHRVGTGLVHDVKGSGLGLAIVKHIVEAHGGRVTVESQPGRGSEFTLRVPLADADDVGRPAAPDDKEQG